MKISKISDIYRKYQKYQKYRKYRDIFHPWLAHTPNGDGVSPKNLRGTCKIWLKIQGVSAYNFGARRYNVTKLPRNVPRGRGVQVGTTFQEGPPP